MHCAVAVNTFYDDFFVLKIATIIPERVQRLYILIIRTGVCCTLKSPFQKFYHRHLDLTARYGVFIIKYYQQSQTVIKISCMLDEFNKIKKV